MKQTYYSCAQSCDFDLCKNCASDPKGVILQKQIGTPAGYELGSVKCSECKKPMYAEELGAGFLHSPNSKYDVCRQCAPCAPHTWLPSNQVKKPVKSTNQSTEPVGERGPFLTSAFVDCADSPIEAFFVGCFLDLPYKVKGEHIYSPDEQRGVTIKAGSNLILYKKEIQETDIALRNDLLVIHRYNEIGNQKLKDDSGIPEVFFTNTLYECEVIITNVSPRSK